MRGGQLLLLAAGLAPARGEAELLRLSGACDYLNFLNGLEFEMQGTTASGAPWYKALTQGYYIYHDPACAGSHDGTPRWIIDNDRPSDTLAKDLDDDDDCNFHAFVDSGSLTQPPLASSWQMFCNGHWQAQPLQLETVQPRVVAGQGTTTVTATTTLGVAYMLQVDGACAYMNYLNGMIFKKQGHTASGSPYYKSTTAAYYIYYDPDCSGVTQGFSRWIIDSDRPSLYKTEDLDDDHDCVYQARVEVLPSQSRTPPHSALWKMMCPGWEDHLITLNEIVTTSTSTSTTATVTTLPSTRTSTSTFTATHTTSVTRTTTVPPTTITSSSTATSTVATTAPAATTTALAAIAATTTTVAAAGNATTAGPAPAPANTTAAPAGCGGFACPANTAPLPNAIVPAGAQADAATCCQPIAVSTESSTATTTVATTQAAAATTTERGTEASTTTRASVQLGTTLPSIPAFLELQGLCSQKASMDGMVFELMGSTRSGSPYYKARGASVYIYYDVDCAGTGAGSARWIVDGSAPDPDREADLDGDGDCNYHARMNSADGSRPPSSGSWRVSCGEAWEDHNLTLAQVSAAAAPTTTSGHAAHGAATTTQEVELEGSTSLVLEGACEYMEAVNGLLFAKEGTTSGGSPWYKSMGENYYIYYDPDCGAAGPNATARWILDDNRPITTLPRDLDGDGDCSYLARLDSTSAARLPSSDTWRMYCGSGWANQVITLKQEFVKITTGTCADVGRVPIVDSGSCVAAAAAVGLVSGPPVVISGDGRPEGCAWDGDGLELQLSSSEANRGNGASGGLQPLCKLDREAGDQQAAVSAAAGLRHGGALLALLGALLLGGRR